MRLLALDTATELCSAALWLDGQVHSRAEQRPRAQAELILPMIDALLQEAQVSLRSLDAIAFGRGPGAFTGVRLALSIAQGLGFASGRPLLAVSDLRAVAQRGLDLHADAQAVLVCQDARMQQVYWGYFRAGQGACGQDGHRFAAAAGPEAVGAPETIQRPEVIAAGPKPVGAGTGFTAYPSLLERFGTCLSAIEPQLRPHAREIARLAAADGPGAAVAPDQAEAVYLRDQVAVSASRD